MRAALAAVLLLLAAAPSAQAAELFYAVTESNRLVSFASDSPGNVRSSVAISGMLESENILGIDIRPSNGRLYGLGSANLLYEIDTGTGQARPVGPLFEVAIRGSSYGFDFNPAVDRVRVVSDSELNMRLNPDDGLVVDRIPSSPSVQPDMDLSYVVGDPSAGRGPNVGGLAYTPGTATQAFGIDTERDTLVRLDPPNDGALNTVGSLGTDAGDPNGFDIGAGGQAYAVLRRAGRPTQELMRVDLGSGLLTLATKRRELSAVGTYLGRQPDPVRALTVAGTVPADRTRPGLVFTPLKTPTVHGLLRGRALTMLASCTEACRVTASLRSGKRRVARTIRFVRERAGVVKVRVVLAGKGRRYVRNHPNRQLRLTVRARDAAGNVTGTR